MLVWLQFISPNDRHSSSSSSSSTEKLSFEALTGGHWWRAKVVVVVALPNIIEYMLSPLSFSEWVYCNCFIAQKELRERESSTRLLPERLLLMMLMLVQLLVQCSLQKLLLSPYSFFACSFPFGVVLVREKERSVMSSRADRTQLNCSTERQQLYFLHLFSSFCAQQLMPSSGSSGGSRHFQTKRRVPSEQQ